MTGTRGEWQGVLLPVDTDSRTARESFVTGAGWPSERVQSDAEVRGRDSGLADTGTSEHVGAPVLETQGLSVGYGSSTVVSGVGLRVHAGEVVTLTGPNGAGKSTILRTVIGLLDALGGTLRIAGRDLASLTARERARLVAAVLTDTVRGELMSVWDVVEMGRYPHTGSLGIARDEDRERVREAMDLVGVWELRDREFARLSDGQRQRVMLARAVCQEPRLLVLDEPTSHLDVRHQVDLLRVLRALARDRGLAVLMTLHELPLARRASDRLVCVRDGGIFAEGTPDEVFCPEVMNVLFDLEDGSYDARTGEVRL